MSHSVIGFEIYLSDRPFHPKGHKKPLTKEAKVAKPLKAYRIGPKRLEKKRDGMDVGGGCVVRKTCHP